MKGRLLIAVQRLFDQQSPHSPNMWAPVAQWIEHQTSNLGVAGSSPARGIFSFLLLPGSSSSDGRIAQSVERWSNKPLVVGSSPTVTTFVFVWREAAYIARILGRVVKALDLSPNGR